MKAAPPIDARSGPGDRVWPLFARYVQKPTLAFTPSQKLLRKIFNASVWCLARRCSGVAQETTSLAGTRTLRLTPQNAGPGRLLYLHGGGFTIGGRHTHRHMAAHIAKAAGMETWLLEYRRAPEHPFPAAPEDTLRAFAELCKDDVPAVAGDSAGGCLALGLLHWAARADLPPPKALALLSPVADLDISGGGLRARLATEMLIPEQWVRNAIKAYLGPHDPKDPYASPLGAPLPSAPPTLIQYAAGEALALDGHRAADALRTAGSTVVEEVYTGVPHVWQINAGRSRAADHAVSAIGAFLRREATT